MNEQLIFVQGAISGTLIAQQILAYSEQKNIGAHNIFLGQVRADEVNNKLVAAIEYTAYKEMALAKMHAIRETIFQKYALTGLLVFHSLGVVNAGEICLFVFTSSAHRKTAIDACVEVVERIKTELPIWGRELFEDASSQWKINR